ncbi:hypothetical protein ABZY31_22830 [Streptomyces sp. NPDC006529]|uniref:hypothetical protein n=1 Tax=Streptomyces sp. NPDC006529 TaxID=3157177 RepID=UPI0033A89AF3
MGLPRHWAVGVCDFALAFGEEGPGAPGGGGLLHLGTFGFGYRDRGRVLLRPETGEVS